MLQRTNTKSHWTALALARYYEDNEEACRTRDLYEYLSDIYDYPDCLSSCLSRLNEGDIIDRVIVKSPNTGKGNTVTAAYYPTPITIETLRDLGEPTELPDGGAPENYDTHIPSERVADEDTVKPPADVGKLPPDYENRPNYSKGGSRDTSEVSLESLDYDIVESDEDGVDWEYHIDQSDEADEDDESEFDDPDVATFGTPEYTHDDGAPNHSINWSDIARRLEEKAHKAESSGLDEIATAYWQFASQALEDSLDAETAYILLGVPLSNLDDYTIEAAET